jgi:hypothetical protein
LKQNQPILNSRGYHTSPLLFLHLPIAVAVSMAGAEHLTKSNEKQEGSCCKYNQNSLLATAPAFPRMGRSATLFRSPRPGAENFVSEDLKNAAPTSTGSGTGWAGNGTRSEIVVNATVGFRRGGSGPPALASGGKLSEVTVGDAPSEHLSE